MAQEGLFENILHYPKVSDIHWEHGSVVRAQDLRLETAGSITAAALASATFGKSFVHTASVTKLYNFGSKLENGQLSDRYRIGTDTGRIVSNRIGYFCIGRYTTADSAALKRSHYTGDQRAVATRHQLRANAIDRPRQGRGLKGQKFKCSLQHCSR